MFKDKCDPGYAEVDKKTIDVDNHSTETGETKEKTRGELYVEKFYHPHPELPKEMPNEMFEIISKAHPGQESHAELIWRLLITGVGELMFPEIPKFGWDYFAQVAENHLSGHKDIEVDGMSNFETQVLHYFRNLGLSTSMLNSDLHRDPISLARRELIYLEGDDSMERVKQLIDVDIPYFIEIGRIKSEMDLKMKREIKVAESDFESIFSLDIKNVEAEIERLEQKGKEQEKKYGLPWYLFLATANVLETPGYDKFKTSNMDSEDYDEYVRMINIGIRKRIPLNGTLLFDAVALDRTNDPFSDLINSLPDPSECQMIYDNFVNRNENQEST